MSENWYGGCVAMKPEKKNGELYSGDCNFTYKIPEIYFEFEGENNFKNKAFEWSSDSVVLTKDNRMVKYTESSLREVLLTDENGESAWVYGGIADFMGYDVDDDAPIKTVEVRWIDEYDWEKSEKRRYKLVLEETSKIGKNDIALTYPAIKDRESDNCDEYVMVVSEK